MTTPEEIFHEETQAAAQRIQARTQAEAAKSEQQRTVEKLNADIEALTAQLAPLQKLPSRYKAEIAQLNAQIAEKVRAHELANMGNPRSRDSRLSGGAPTQYFITSNGVIKANG